MDCVNPVRSITDGSQARNDEPRPHVPVFAIPPICRILSIHSNMRKLKNLLREHRICCNEFFYSNLSVSLLPSLSPPPLLSLWRSWISPRFSRPTSHRTATIKRYDTFWLRSGFITGTLVVQQKFKGLIAVDTSGLLECGGSGVLLIVRTFRGFAGRGRKGERAQGTEMKNQ